MSHYYYPVLHSLKDGFSIKIRCLWCTQPRHANMSLLSQHLEAQLLLLQAEVPAPESNA